MIKKELKLKAKLLNPEIVETMAKKIGKYNGTENSTDYFFKVENSNISEFRIRKIKETKQIKFKIPISRNTFQENEEYDFNIDDLEDFTKMLEVFGLKLDAMIRKSAKIYEIDKISVRIVQAEQIGSFLELTIKCKETFNDYDKKKMLELFRKLGISESAIDSRYYNQIKNGEIK